MCTDDDDVKNGSINMWGPNRSIWLNNNFTLTI